MTADELVAALGLPTASRVDQRVPKKLLIENGAATATDKRQINDGIEALQWVAALKPATIAVVEYRDDIREYVEIALLRVTFRAKAKAPRLVELIHRAVPYPLLLVTETAGGASLSMAQKRWSQNEAAATVLDGEVVTATAEEIGNDAISAAFRDALALARQPRSSLFALYSGWIHTVTALHIARITGTFFLPASQEHAVIRREALAEFARLEAQIVNVRAAAAKEKQMARQVELNLELQRLRAAHAAARSRL